MGTALALFDELFTQQRSTKCNDLNKIALISSFSIRWVFPLVWKANPRWRRQAKFNVSRSDISVEMVCLSQTYFRKLEEQVNKKYKHTQSYLIVVSLSSYAEYIIRICYQRDFGDAHGLYVFFQ